MPSQQKPKNPLSAIVTLVVLVLILKACVFNSDTSVSSPTSKGIITQASSPSIDSEQLKKEADSLAAIDEKAKAAFHKTKAGKIQLKHPDWSDDDCDRVAKNLIWIGMSIDMVIYERGSDFTKHTSNYGSGPEYQFCWEDYETSCFYCGSDGLVTAYN